MIPVLTSKKASELPVSEVVSILQVSAGRGEKGVGSKVRRFGPRSVLSNRTSVRTEVLSTVLSILVVTS